MGSYERPGKYRTGWLGWLIIIVIVGLLVIGYLNS